VLKQRSDTQEYINRLMYEARLGCPPPESIKEDISEEVWNEINAIADIELKRSGRM